MKDRNESGWEGIEMIIRQQIEIRSVSGQIGIEKTPGQLRIDHRRSEISVQNTPARLQIQREKPAVVIDASECWNERGHKTVERFLADNTAESKRKVTENIAAAASQGRRMGDIGRSPDTRLLIAQIAKEKCARPAELRFTRIPDSRPQVQVTGYMDMRWSDSDIQFDVSRHDVSIQYQRSQLRFYMMRKPEIHINLVDVRA
ncbi:MAG: DUF6470 family protein [Peptococcaceae bacterium]|jgi:hypothetical protein|nr:DUF6470 family protein [Peptococcaceae bacterium]